MINRLIQSEKSTAQNDCCKETVESRQAAEPRGVYHTSFGVFTPGARAEDQTLFIKF